MTDLLTNSLTDLLTDSLILTHWANSLTDTYSVIADSLNHSLTYTHALAHLYNR